MEAFDLTLIWAGIIAFGVIMYVLMDGFDLAAGRFPSGVQHHAASALHWGFPDAGGSTVAALAQGIMVGLLLGLLFVIPFVLVYTAWTCWVFRGKVRAGEGCH